MDCGRWPRYKGVERSVVVGGAMPGITSAVGSYDEEMRVCELFNGSVKEWVREKVASMFIEEEANRICYISLGVFEMGDLMAWWFTKDGTYTASLGYFDVQRQVHVYGQSCL